MATEKQKETRLPALLESNQKIFAEIRDLIRFHSETKDNEKSIHISTTDLYVCSRIGPNSQRI